VTGDAQNPYDEPGFFGAYARLPRQELGLDGAPEWAAMRSMLPDSLGGERVLDLGCGYGWLCRWAESAGAAEVVGVDLSERMLARAAEFDDAGHITYVRADLERFEPAGAFDVVVSSLTLHYVADLPRLVEAVAASLRDGGRLVFSCEHPIYLAPADPRFSTGPRFPEWQLSRYHDEGERRVDWLGTTGVVKYHRRIDTIVRTLLDAGFELTDLVEFAPSTDDLAAHPDWAPEVERPMILLVGATLRTGA